MDGVEYRREMNRNYLVILPEPGRNERYTVRMLLGNRIPGLLQFQEKSVNGEKKYYYDITSRQPLGRILERRTIKEAELRTVFFDLLFTLRQMERFLLDENQICLKPEYIYLEPDTFRCSFCLVPGRYEDFESAFRELAQYFLNHVHHHDSGAVVLAFSIFQECQKENFGMEDIVRCLEQVGDNPEKEPEKERWSRNPDHEERAEPKDDWEDDSWTKEWKPEYEKDQTEGKRLPAAAFLLRTGILALIIGFPASVFFLFGAEEMAARWPMIAGGEGILMLLFFLISGKDGKNDTAEKSDPAEKGYPAEERRYNIPTEMICMPGERKISAAGKEDITALAEKNEWIRALSKPYETCTSDIEKCGNDAEEEIQTILLTDSPVHGGEKKLIPLNGGPPVTISYMPFLIGKNRELSDFCLDIPGISRLHVKIEETPEGYTITDLNSTNGTSVDGEMLNANETRALVLGSEISIASLRYRFQ